MPLHPHRMLYTAFLLIACLSGCISEPPPVAESLATAYVTVETVAEAVVTASDQGLITTDQRAFARTQLQTAKDILDVGTEFVRIGNESEARQSLNEATNKIHSVEEILP